MKQIIKNILKEVWRVISLISFLIFFELIITSIIISWTVALEFLYHLGYDVTRLAIIVKWISIIAWVTGGIVIIRIGDKLILKKK